MSTIRTDPITGRRVIIASERADRPRTDRREDRGLGAGDCPFCRDPSEMTPSPIDSFSNDSDADVRVVPNKFPAVSSDEELTTNETGMFWQSTGVGAHEVVIEASDHVVDLTALDTDGVDTVLEAWQSRIRDLAGDQRLESAIVFKNHGAAAGASLEHAHSQLVALPFTPPTLEAELEGARSHLDEGGTCVFCDIVESARESGERLVAEDDSVTVVAPFASRSPFELTIYPTNHASRFEAMSPELRRQVARRFLETLGRLERALDAPPYNVVLHTAPLRSDELDHFHWHLEIIPMLSHVAGFEWGAGSYINPTPPERAARHLRRMQSRVGDR